jgi:hypothetical protein
MQAFQTPAYGITVAEVRIQLVGLFACELVHAKAHQSERLNDRTSAPSGLVYHARFSLACTFGRAKYLKNPRTATVSVGLVGSAGPAATLALCSIHDPTTKY